ncbi:hypothetical protein D0Z00_001909 [Geotrichum galactomycetum]|uniref:Uncharacterized protein n=1 Tax=Geotrichum galactomycetum TaxID=27317 RepID=A0ACB6V5Q2_9ASCO|nr:hypothetical protein D0Z00_001909 [Geotrichum candidum]
MQIKEKVRQAEARWRSVPLVDKSSGAPAGGVTGIGAVGRVFGMNADPAAAAGQQQLNGGQTQPQQSQPQEQQQQAEPITVDKHANPPKPIERHNPSEGFQPVAWSQKPIKRG